MANFAAATLAGLQADNLTLERGGRTLFRGLNFGAVAGDALAVEGPNGSGKSSLLRFLAGFLRETAGAVTITLRDGTKLFEAEERGHVVGWLGHQDGAKPQMTPFELLEFYARYYGVPGNVDAALQETDLARARDLPAQFLSAGQKKRLALARLKLCGRPLWLLDEPLAALDLAGKALATRFIADHCQSGGIVIAATHEPLGVSSGRVTLGQR